MLGSAATTSLCGCRSGADDADVPLSTARQPHLTVRLSYYSITKAPPDNRGSDLLISALYSTEGNALNDELGKEQVYNYYRYDG